jgi:hypothetical protein
MRKLLAHYPGCAPRRDLPTIVDDLCAAASAELRAAGRR